MTDRGFLMGGIFFHEGNFDFVDGVTLDDYLLLDEVFLGQTGVL